MQLSSLKIVLLYLNSAPLTPAAPYSGVGTTCILCPSAAPVPAEVIGTHHGTFHCDEALAVAMLKVLPE